MPLRNNRIVPSFDLSTMCVNVSALVAGLGLTGFALGFAFRDVLSNLLAGFLILLYRPFGRGDLINVTGLEGTVLHIDLRYTTLDSADQTILVPNSNLFTNPITIAKASASKEGTPDRSTAVPEPQPPTVLTH